MTAKIVEFPEPGPRAARQSPHDPRRPKPVEGFSTVAEVLDEAKKPGRRKFSDVRRSETPERRVRIDAAKAEMARAEGDHALSVAPDGTVTDPLDDRPLRTHANAVHDKKDRRFDKTALHFDQHGKLMSHADYIAHCEKYDYAWRSIQSGDRILDVGCGTDLPLMRAINFVQSQAAKVMGRVGGCYVGLDMNKLKETGIAWATLLGETDITSEDGFESALAAIPGNVTEAHEWSETPRGYSLMICLEVIEHMGVEDGRKMLENLRDLLSPDGRIILSTPVYDGKAQARNHIHEYFIPELQELIESAGLTVVRRMGTFTSEPTLKRWMKANRPDWYALYMEAREFHSSGYMSGVIAPMVPDIARNNVWDLVKA